MAINYNDDPMTDYSVQPVQPEQGLMAKLKANPSSLNLILNGLGLLGSKYKSGADRYMNRISTGLLDQSKSRSQAKRDAEAKRVNDAQIENRARLTAIRQAEEDRAMQAREQFGLLLGQKGGEYQMSSDEMFPGEAPIQGLQQTGSGFLGGQMGAGEFAASIAGIPGYEGAGVGMMSRIGSDNAALTQSMIDAGVKADGDMFDNEDKLRKAYDKASSAFYDQAAAYSRVVSSAKDPSGAGDLALIFNYMKVLDPGSTVREGEFATAQNSGGIEGKIRSLYNSVVDGKRLGHTQRADFVDRAGRLYSGAQQLHQTLDGRYQKLADNYGVNADNILYDPGLEIWKYPQELIDSEGEDGQQSVRAPRIGDVMDDPDSPTGRVTFNGSKWVTHND